MRSVPARAPGGAGLVVVLCLLRLFPLALVAAAVSVPLLFVLYLWDVDVYEEEPLIVLTFTVAWGAVVGAGLGLRGAAAREPGVVCAGGPDTHNLVWLGGPALLAVVLSLAGPLLLLPYRSFNDVLDGVTFGASARRRCSPPRRSPTRPSSCTSASAPPATSGSGSRGCSRSAWRCPCSRPARRGRLRRVLAPLPRARPATGAPLGPARLAVRGGPARGGALLVGASVAELYLKQWATLHHGGARRLAALVWLRRLIDLGLREEALEGRSGRRSSARTARRETPAHSFCGECGVALRALPKAREPHDDEAPRTAARCRKVAVFAALAAARSGSPRSRSCSPARPPRNPRAAGRPLRDTTGPPVAAPHVVAGVVPVGNGWTSDLGVGVRYSDDWDTSSQDANGIVLQARPAASSSSWRSLVGPRA